MVGVIRRRIAVQVSGLLLLGALVPLGAVGWFITDRAERDLRRELDESHYRIARVSSALVDDYMNAASARLRTIAALVGESAADPNTTDARKLATDLNGLMEPTQVFLEMSYYTNEPEPKQYAQTLQRDYSNRGPDNLRITNANRQNPLFNEPLVKNMGYNELNLPPGADLPYLNFSAPVPRGKATLGVLTAQLDLKPVSTILKSVGGAEYVELLDPAGKTLAASGTKPAGAVFETRHAGGREGWSLVVRESEDAAFEPIRRTRRQIVTGLAIAAGLALLLSIGLSSWLLRPVRTLTDAAQEIERGNLAARARIDRPDELGRLAATFDRMAAAVEALDTAKSEFVANVSHELRTPLTSIKCTIANLQEGIGGPESLARVRDDIDRLIKLVNDLLDLAKLDAGRVTLSKSPVDLAALARSCAESLKPLGDVAVEGSSIPISADPARLHQVLTNVIDNAIKFSDGGRVVVRVNDGTVAITDSGPGVPPEAAERIFDRFVQVEGASGVKNRGAGLGLSIAKKIVDLHGGTIRVQGSTFTVELPRG